MFVNKAAGNRAASLLPMGLRGETGQTISADSQAQPGLSESAPSSPLFSVDPQSSLGNTPFLALGKPNPAIPFTQGVCGVYGRYKADSKITFEGKCLYPWEFMATGTGVSGLVVGAGRQITGQINHSSAVNEKDKICTLGQFQMEWFSIRGPSGERAWADKKFAGLDNQCPGMGNESIAI